MHLYFYQSVISVQPSGGSRLCNHSVPATGIKRSEGSTAALNSLTTSSVCIYLKAQTITFIKHCRETKHSRRHFICLPKLKSEFSPTRPCSRPVIFLYQRSLITPRPRQATMLTRISRAIGCMFPSVRRLIMQRETLETNISPPPDLDV